MDRVQIALFRGALALAGATEAQTAMRLRHRAGLSGR